MESNNIIEKIFKEHPLLENKEFHIVNDINPICEDHWLVFPKNKVDSFAHCSKESLAHLFDELKSHLKENFYFFERGNVAFCTSFNEKIYAHIHILPIYCFGPDLIRELNQKLDGTQLRELSEFSQINYIGEYLLYGEWEKEMYIKSSFANPRKRFIREFLKEHKIDR